MADRLPAHRDAGKQYPGHDTLELLVNCISRLDLQTKILFVGDPAQLPPVGEEESRCFKHIQQRTDLTEVMRYGGSIGSFSAQVRMNLDCPVLRLPLSDRTSDKLLSPAE